MAEQSGPYTIRPEMDGSDCWVVCGPGINGYGTAMNVALRACDRYNRVYATGFAAGVASAARQGGDHVGDVTELIEAARKADQAYNRDGLIPHDTMVALRDSIARLGPDTKGTPDDTR